VTKTLHKVPSLEFRSADAEKLTWTDEIHLGPVYSNLEHHLPGWTGISTCFWGVQNIILCCVLLLINKAIINKLYIWLLGSKAAPQCWSVPPISSHHRAEPLKNITVWFYVLLCLFLSNQPAVLMCAAVSQEVFGRQTSPCSRSATQDGQITQCLKFQPNNAVTVWRDGDLAAIVTLHSAPWENRKTVWYDSSATQKSTDHFCVRL